MKSIATFLIVLLFVSCTNAPVVTAPQKETPKALSASGSSSDLGFSKRSEGDLMQQLYNELESKNIGLKQLEDKINELYSSKSDSTNEFAQFNEKNQEYFASANRHIATIRDSVLRDKVKGLMEENIKKYTASVAKHKELLKLIETKDLSIADLHTLLKIVKTLPLIEKYQQEQLPGTKSLEGYSKQQDAALKMEDSLSRK